MNHIVRNSALCGTDWCDAKTEIAALKNTLAIHDKLFEERDAKIESIHAQIEVLTKDRDLWQDECGDAKVELADMTKERDEIQTKWDYYQQLCRDHDANGIGDLIVQRND